MIAVGGWQETEMGENQPGEQLLCPFYKQRRYIPVVHFIVRKGSKSKGLSGFFPCLILKVQPFFHFLPGGVARVLQVSQPPKSVPLPPSQLFSDMAPWDSLGL